MSDWMYFVLALVALMIPSYAGSWIAQRKKIGKDEKRPTIRFWFETETAADTNEVVQIMKDFIQEHGHKFKRVDVTLKEWEQ